jgi:DNA-binding beta-propeller fold protein YncE
MQVGSIHRRGSLVRRICVIAAPALLLMWLGLIVQPGDAEAARTSDQNRDGVVDIDDVAIFSQNELGQDWQSVDWCQWLATPHKFGKHLEELLDFIDEYFRCSGGDLLVVRNPNNYPTRIAWGPGAQRLYVSDARIGSVFVYDAALTLIGEMRVRGKPLGIAVDTSGNVYVGNNEFDEVAVYSPEGIKLSTFGSGTIQMPNDLAFDQNGILYVADSQLDKIWLFDPASGESLGHIGAGHLRFPVALAIAGGELFVADQSNFNVKVFDLQGNLLRSLGGPVSQGSLGYKW